MKSGKQGATDKAGQPLFPPAASHPGPGGERSIIVTGASSQIGRFLLPMLVASGFLVHAISRKPPAAHQVTADTSIFWHQIDINDRAASIAMPAYALIHLAPLSTLPPLVATLAQLGVKRIIAFGSTSRFSKANSPNRQEQELVQGFIDAEQALAEQCERLGIGWTLFRPTLIYGCGLDKNITTIARFINRFGFFPMVGGGIGLRQPVHAEDLAQASLAAMVSPASCNKGYNLSGGRTLTYLAMVETIFNALGKKPRVIHIPLALLQGFLACLRLLPGYSYITPAMAARINEDLCFSHHDAAQDLDFKPRPFDQGQLQSHADQGLTAAPIRPAGKSSSCRPN